MAALKALQLPLSDESVRALSVGDSVRLSGVMLTGRDAVHKWMIETFIRKKRAPQGDDLETYAAIRPLLDGGAIYHCGPVVAGVAEQNYRFVAAGPTTSIREEPYQGEVMGFFNVKAVIGKGGMGKKTLAACRTVSGVYLHAVGGAASLIAQSVRRVLAVHKLDLGVPEAMWVIEVSDFPAVVTMDAHGNSLHAEVAAHSGNVLATLTTD
ncbi:MAG: FumA C-terminus/TtdB family hydratase beta subunit [Anaerolineales bacterium]|jgi:fumarate hydratase class I|nr:FumA C-terminus/TtdB family hydratase beta subunit [Anaerolineales bacterium]HJL70713.1 FumA C-terminus/TtdB family hydratase beta subunit [Anaerolineales bacterium]HJO33348.1 FumA C-terminus/TtdB family hydratase beta subunit [Anaerolineales bacterium]|tara:strand:- start:644 stop:1273 length:630 start_codon:yes stop_codon:yes gene_type:complete